MKDDRSTAHSLSDKTLKRMLTSHSNPEDERNFALSWVIRPRQQDGYSHTGSNTDFRCGDWFDPDRTSSVSDAELRDRMFEFALDSW